MGASVHATSAPTAIIERPTRPDKRNDTCCFVLLGGGVNAALALKHGACRLHGRLASSDPRASISRLCRKQSSALRLQGERRVWLSPTSPPCTARASTCTV